MSRLLYLIYRPPLQTNLVPPSATFIDQSSIASVTRLFVWALTEHQPAAALGSGI